MGLLDRLKSMVSEMTEEEKKEFFDEMDTSQEEPEPEPEPLPDKFECTDEDVQPISEIRQELLDMKILFADICLEFDRQKESMLEDMSKKQEEMLEVVELIKEKYISDPKEREQYLLRLNITSDESSFLFKNDRS